MKNSLLFHLTGAVLGKDAHSSVLHAIGQRKVVVANGDKAGHI